MVPHECFPRVLVVRSLRNELNYTVFAVCVNEFEAAYVEQVRMIECLQLGAEPSSETQLAPASVRVDQGDHF